VRSSFIGNLVATLIGKLPPRWQQLLGHIAVKNALLLYGVQISTYVFPLITMPYLWRVLGPEKTGLIGFALSFTWYFYTLTEYGFDLTATRRIAIHKDNPQQISRIFSAVMTAKVLLTGAGFVVMMGVVFATPKLRAHWPLYPITFLTVLGGLFFPMWLYQGMEKLGYVGARDFAAKLAAMVLIFILVRRQSDYLMAAGIQGAAMTVAGIASLVMAPKVCGVQFVMPSAHEVFEVLREGWPVFLSMAALSLTASTDNVILGFVSSAVEVGYYMAAFRLIVALRMLVVPIVTALYPHISHMASKSTEDALRFLRKYTLYLTAPFALGSAILLVTAPLVVRILAGRQYGPTAPLLRIMAPSPFLLSLAHIYSTYFMLAFGYEKQWSRIVLMQTALNFVLVGSLIWILKPTVAMAVTSTALDLFSVAASYHFYRRHASTGKALAV
jgi:O-antigen/teichoic acid export membrane protein